MSFAPAASRVQELLAAWGQRNGYTAFCKLYGAAINKTRSDGTADINGQEIKAVYKVHLKLLNTAVELAGRASPPSSRCIEWGECLEPHGRALGELLPSCPARHCKPGDTNTEQAATRRSKWKMVRELLKQDAGCGTGWDDTKKRKFVRRYNLEYQKVTNFQRLTIKKLSEIIRDLRKHSKKDTN